MKSLIVVESPTKARTLTRFLGKDYSVEATMGHVKDLPKSKLSVDIEKNFEPDYVLVPKKRDSVKTIKEEAKKADKIYLATDPDREGEAIAAHVNEILTKEVAKKKDIERIVFHEITKSAVEHAIENPRGVDVNLVDAQIARRVLDRLVGYKLSPLLWKKVRRGLSAGRVQSVALRLIVEREREIEKFNPTEYWEIYADVFRDVKRNLFRVQLSKINDKKAQIGDKKTAKSIVSGLEKANYRVEDVKKRTVNKGPYPPFTTSTLTQTTARFYSWSAKKTMSVAQKLYEQGLITYHRTDSTNISKEAIGKVRKYISQMHGDKYLPEKPRIYKTKAKVAQEAHEAIRPTGLKKEPGIKAKRFRRDMETLYALIFKRFVASQMANSVFDETTILVRADEKDKDSYYILRASGQIMRFDGWRKVIPLSKETSVSLPDVDKGDPLNLDKVDSQQKFTQPPPRYNEASLIKTLEKLGIGRPSTYAPIISTIQGRQYVEKEQGRFSPTPVGVAVNDFLVGNFPDVFDYSFTAEMEDDLDDVAKGEESWREVIGAFWSPFEGKLEKVEDKAKRVEIETESLGKKCPKCKKGELVVRIGRFGKFVSCSRFPDCDYKEKYIEKIGMKCPECGKGDVIVKTTRRGKKFFGCSRYPKCEWASWKNPKKEEKE
jgi:DNA topoisomerase-1